MGLHHFVQAKLSALDDRTETPLVNLARELGT